VSESEDQKGAGKKPAEKQAPKMVTINVHPDGTKGAEKAIFVGLNGVGYRIKRGVDVQVPREVMLVLQESVKTVYEQVTNEDGSVRMEAREIPTYPFSVKES
jgi:hypothetical protein